MGVSFMPRQEPAVALRIPEALRKLLIAEAARHETTLSAVILDHLCKSVGFPQRPLRKVRRPTLETPLPHIGPRRDPKRDDEAKGTGT
jgi:hypothetical protein